MHDYLKAIGLSDIKSKKDLNKMIETICTHPQKDVVTSEDVEIAIGEKSIFFGEHIGLKVIGEYDEEGNFLADYCVPYLESDHVTIEEIVDVEKHTDRNSYVGISDNPNIGVSIIYHLLNMVDYLDYSSQVVNDDAVRKVSLTGLSISGKIILPVLKNEDDRMISEKNTTKRNRKISAARNGDLEAIESLTLEDMDLYTMAAQRARKEDILSIVESYFMPYGIACDQYSILGTILSCEKIENRYSKEQIYLMQIECNSLIFDICINENDLLGEPAIGRRFRGQIWMQGKVEYDHLMG